MEKKGRRMAEV